MIPGATYAHCEYEEECAEAWREMACRRFKPQWVKLMKDPATRRQAKAAKKRERKRIRKEIEELNQ